jgi:glycosyltransferase involved in cell wall biosynthesis
VHEALAAGVPVIAADIPVFRDLGAGVRLVSPLDGEAWIEAVRATNRSDEASGSVLPDEETQYFERLSQFLGDI